MPTRSVLATIQSSMATTMRCWERPGPGTTPRAPDRRITRKLVGSMPPRTRAPFSPGRITSAIWNGHGNQLAAPLRSATARPVSGSGFSKTRRPPSAGTAVGYGNYCVQQLRSPFLRYSGAGDLSLSLYYFNDTEFDYDYSNLRRCAAGRPVAAEQPGVYQQDRSGSRPRRLLRRRISSTTAW